MSIRVFAWFLIACTGTALSRAQTFSVLYTFTGGADGGYPAYGGLTVDPAEGVLYGATPFGGNVTCPPSPSATVPGPGCGVVFRFDPAKNKQDVLYTFSGTSDGSNPWAGVIRDSRGNLFGTTTFGGTYGAGVLFEVSRTGTETVIHTFSDTDGAYPTGSLLPGGENVLIGTTVAGGDLDGCYDSGCGIVFSANTSGEFKVLHRFTGLGQVNGATPTHGLIADSAGNLYGSTESGGFSYCSNFLSFEPVEPFIGGCGTVFKLDPTGKEQPLYVFGAAPDGSDPRGNLVRDNAGNLYGTTFYGGLYGNGTIFKLDPTGHETVLYNFRGSADGANPWSGLVRDPAGNLYGTANHAGGACFCGTVFKLDPAGNFRVLHTFSGPDGQYPGEPLILFNGSLYGMTSGGGTLSDGSPGTGTIFEITLP